MRFREALFAMLIPILSVVGCAETNNPDEGKEEGQWISKTQWSNHIENYEFIFPDKGYAFENRDALVQECMIAIAENMQLIEMDGFNVPYKIIFYPSKADMKQDVNIGVSGHADYWNKQVGFVATDDVETIKAENIIPPPIKHETMHMIAMEQWGFPPADNFWLNEGLATYAANNCNGFTVAEVYRYLLDQKMLIPMDALVNDFYANDEMISYHQSAYVAQYLLEHYGIEKFSALWQGGFTSFEEVYEMPFSEMELRINSDLQEKVPNVVEVDWERFKKGCK